MVSYSLMKEYFWFIYDAKDMLKHPTKECNKEKAIKEIRKFRSKIKELYENADPARYFEQDYDGFIRKTWLKGTISDYTEENLEYLKEINWIPMRYEDWDCTGYQFTNWIYFAKFSGINKIAMYEGIGTDL